MKKLGLAVVEPDQHLLNSLSIAIRDLEIILIEDD